MVERLNIEQHVQSAATYYSHATHVNQCLQDLIE